MRSLIAFTFLATLAALIPASPVHAGDPIADVDAWDKATVACLAKAEEACLNAQLTAHLPPGSDDETSQAQHAVQEYASAFSSGGVFATYELIAEETGGLFVRRLWFIEGNDGTGVSFYVVLMKMKGDWYVKKFDFSSKEADLEDYLGFKI